MAACPAMRIVLHVGPNALQHLQGFTVFGLVEACRNSADELGSKSENLACRNHYSVGSSTWHCTEGRVSLSSYGCEVRSPVTRSIGGQRFIWKCSPYSLLLFLPRCGLWPGSEAFVLLTLKVNRAGNWIAACPLFHQDNLVIVQLSDESHSGTKNSIKN